MRIDLGPFPLPMPSARSPRASACHPPPTAACTALSAAPSAAAAAADSRVRRPGTGGKNSPAAAAAVAAAAHRRRRHPLLLLLLRLLLFLPPPQPPPRHPWERWGRRGCRRRDAWARHPPGCLSRVTREEKGTRWRDFRRGVKSFFCCVHLTKTKQLSFFLFLSLSLSSSRDSLLPLVRPSLTSSFTLGGEGRTCVCVCVCVRVCVRVYVCVCVCRADRMSPTVKIKKMKDLAQKKGQTPFVVGRMLHSRSRELSYLSRARVRRRCAPP